MYYYLKGAWFLPFRGRQIHLILPCCNPEGCWRFCIKDLEVGESSLPGCLWRGHGGSIKEGATLQFRPKRPRTVAGAAACSFLWATLQRKHMSYTRYVRAIHYIMRPSVYISIDVYVYYLGERERERAKPQTSVYIHMRINIYTYVYAGTITARNPVSIRNLAPLS